MVEVVWLHMCLGVIYDGEGGGGQTEHVKCMYV